MALKRLQKELTDINANPSDHFSAGPADGKNLYKWKATIIGPKDTPYEGGIFNIDVDLPTDYPFKAPKMVLTTKMYHPNVHSDGKFACHFPLICDSWSPAITIQRCLLTFVSMLFDPDIENPAEQSVANVFKSDHIKFEKTAREWTSKYAM